MGNITLADKARWWAQSVNGIEIVPVESVADIEDPKVRDAFVYAQERAGKTAFRGQKRLRTHWYDPRGTLYVFLPNIDSEGELDRLCLRETISRNGLSAVLSSDKLDLMGFMRYQDMTVAEKERIRGILESSGETPNSVTVGRMFLHEKAMPVPHPDRTGRSPEGAAWWHEFKYVVNADRQFWNAVELDSFQLPSIVSSAMRSYAFTRQEAAHASEGQGSPANIRSEIEKLYNVESGNGEKIDRKKALRLGMTPDVLVSAAPWLHGIPMELPVEALFGRIEDDPRHERFVSATKLTKKDRHQYSLLALTDIKEQLAHPLAVFADPASASTATVLLPKRAGVRGENEGNLFTAITPVEVNRNRFDEWSRSRGSGKWVNSIKTIFPTSDRQTVMRLAAKKAVLYLAPSFFSEWFQPALQRIEAAYDEYFKLYGIEKPTRKEIDVIMAKAQAEKEKAVLAYSPKKEESTEKSSSSIDSRFAYRLDGGRGSAGLLLSYAEFVSAAESATKVIINFENPPILSQNKILFSIAPVDTAPDLFERTTVDAIVDRIRQGKVAVHYIGADDPVIVAASVPEGRRVLGYSNGKDIFLSEAEAGLETTIHEYTHVWCEFVRFLDPEGWFKIKKAMKKSQTWDRIKSDPAYAAIAGDENLLAGEVMADISGRVNAKTVRDGFAEGKTLEEIAKDTLLKWNYVGSTALKLDWEFSPRHLSHMVLQDLVKGNYINAVSFFHDKRVKFNISDNMADEKTLMKAMAARRRDEKNLMKAIAASRRDLLLELPAEIRNIVNQSDRLRNKGVPSDDEAKEKAHAADKRLLARIDAVMDAKAKELLHSYHALSINDGALSQLLHPYVTLPNNDGTLPLLEFAAKKYELVEALHSQVLHPNEQAQKDAEAFLSGKAKEYVPEPIDVSDIQLGDYGKRLAEELALYIYSRRYAFLYEKLTERKEFHERLFAEDLYHVMEYKYTVLPDELKAPWRSAAEATLKIFLSKVLPEPTEAALMDAVKMDSSLGLRWGRTWDKLLEDLARNVHEVWAADKMAAGWKFGDTKSFAQKTHPDLIPYENLSDEAKKFFQFDVRILAGIIRTEIDKDVDEKERRLRAAKKAEEPVVIQRQKAEEVKTLIDDLGLEPVNEQAQKDAEAFLSGKAKEYVPEPIDVTGPHVDKQPAVAATTERVAESPADGIAPNRNLGVRAIVASDAWERGICASKQNVLFVFTDNTDRNSGFNIVPRLSPYYKLYGDGVNVLHYPNVTTAILRGLENAMPVSTQRWYHDGARGESGRWTDKDAELFRETVYGELDNIERTLEANPGKYQFICYPKDDGLFNGKVAAISEDRTPVLYGILKEELQAFHERIGVSVIEKKGCKPIPVKDYPAVFEPKEGAVKTQAASHESDKVWTLIQEPNGKWNYTNAKGEKMTDKPFDKAIPFKNGEARVVRNGQCGIIGTDGIIKKAWNLPVRAERVPIPSPHKP